MWALIIVLAAAAGWSIVRLLPFSWHRLEAVSASVTVGFVVAPWAYFVASAVLGWRLGLVVATAVLALGVAVSEFWVHRRLQFKPLPDRSFAGVGLWVAAAVVCLWMSSLVISSYAFHSHDAWFSNGNVWGDSPLHVALVTQFSHGSTLDLVAPYYKLGPLTYPFMSDFFSGVLMRFTTNWVDGLAVPTLVMMLALLGMLYFAAKRLLNSARAAWLAWYMMVFSGSLIGFIRVIWQLENHLGSYREIIMAQGRATTDSYVNFFYSHPLPQRAYLFGMPLLLVVGLIALELYRRRGAKPYDRRGLKVAGIIAGMLVGTMPLVHTHSFIVLAAILGLGSVLLWWRERKLPTGWVPMLAVGGLLAGPQFLWQVVHGYHQGFSHWIFGWVVINDSASTANWLVFWLSQLGWLLVVILAGWYFMRRMKVPSEVWFIYAVGVLIFIVCNVYVFQPSIWDNMKLFEYSFWFIMLVSAVILAAWSRYLWGKVVVAGIILSLCATGFMTLVLSGYTQDYQLLSAQEVNFGERMRTALPRDAYLLVGDQHNSPITMLADRKVVMTYAGWYNLYGGDWTQTYYDRETMLQGGPDAERLIRKYRANFAAFSDSELNSEGVNLTFFETHYKLFDNEAGWWVFDLRNPR